MRNFFARTLAYIGKKYVPLQAETFNKDLTMSTGYMTQDGNMLNLTLAMNALQSTPWFKASVRDIRAFRVEDWSDFTGFFKTE